MVSDLRYAWRQLRKAPGFALTAMLTLALGIGATTAIFTLVYDVMLRPLPLPHAEQLVRVQEKVAEWTRDVSDAAGECESLHVLAAAQQELRGDGGAGGV